MFVDSGTEHPNMDVSQIEELITPRTKVIAPVHYAGVSCDMDAIMQLADRYGLFVVEDAAQAIDSYYKDKPLGSIGHLSAFSFHETKNIISGEGGMLAINDMSFAKRAEIIWEKGTNRSAFWRGEVDKYGWVDIGSSFLPSEVISAFLYAQLEHLDRIQCQRKRIWNMYFKELSSLDSRGLFKLPSSPEGTTNNAHMFYLVMRDAETRVSFIEHLKSWGVLSVFHYLSLHKSPYYAPKHDGRELPMSDFYSDCLVRLPMYYELGIDQQQRVIDSIKKWHSN